MHLKSPNLSKMFFSTELCTPRVGTLWVGGMKDEGDAWLFSAALQRRLKINRPLPAQTCGGIYALRLPYSNPDHLNVATTSKSRCRKTGCGMFFPACSTWRSVIGVFRAHRKKTDRKRKKNK